MISRLLLTLAFLATAVAPTPARAVEPRAFCDFETFLKRLVPSGWIDKRPRLTAEQAWAKLEPIHAEQWRKSLAVSPAQEMGLTDEEALKLLKALSPDAGPNGGVHLRNRTYRVKLEKGQGAIVKKNFLQEEHDFDRGRVVRIPHAARWEPFAYHLNRHLKTKVVPPSLMLDPETSAQLLIRSTPLTLQQAQKLPEEWAKLCNIRLMDALLQNLDRTEGAFNLVRGNHLVGIDWDLSKVRETYVPHHPIKYFSSAGMQLGEFRLAFGHDLPPVFSQSVVDQLRALDATAIDGIAREAGTPISAAEREAILMARESLLQMIDSGQAKILPGP